MTLLDDLEGHAQRGHEDRGAALDDDLHLFCHAARHGGQQVDAEGLVGALAHRRDFGRHRRVTHGARTECAESPGFGDGADQRGVGHPAHAGQHDRVLDAQQLRQARAHGGRPSFS